MAALRRLGLTSLPGKPTLCPSSGSKRMRQFLALLVIMLVLAPFAEAQERPILVPTRDVTVAYRASGQGGGTDIRMSWLPARSMMRMDLPGGQGWLLVDVQAGTGIMVIEAQRMVMDMPAGQMPPGSLAWSRTARYTRDGTGRFANTDCTHWRMEDRGETARVCLTGDGVMLRAESLSGQAASRGTLEATQVTYGAQDSARFQRPAGFQSFQMPAGMPPGSAQALPRGNAIPPPGVAKPER